ncbi:MAG TPA: sugar phosphate nucleotidyltransferase [Alphaproteobacteria bacterium]|nr:sugar phosphate nucleotidyltransferase [Alphaproteobacteria bacterium]
MKALILAGGKGQRLYPFTAHLPKPLMPLGDMPILEIILRRLKVFGITDVILAVNHLASLIEAYFTDGRRLGIRITYVREEVPLGTAGPISLVEDFDGTMLVMNGDILTDIDIDSFVSSHGASGSVLSIGSFPDEIAVDAGVLDVGADGRVRTYREKPRIRHRISMGAYLVEPAVKQHLRPGMPADMPQLIEAAIGSGAVVTAFDHDGYWLDIGRPEDYARAQASYDDISAGLLHRRKPAVATA